MGKLKHLNQEFYKDNVPYNPDKDSEYGIVPFPMKANYIDDVLKEVIKYGVEVKAKTQDKKLDHLRNVECWRLNQKSSFTAEIINNALVEINKIFNYKLSGLQDLQYLEYHEGSKYDWHSDVGGAISSMRKISISWTLNMGYIGGDLQFFGDGGEIITINPEPTKLVAFTSFLNHRVTPVKSGIRKCIVAWVFGESWR
tara:strand:+ start:822 stop:1415 length:594 start_codon:yes stop_codon:yes gene_type:complete